MIDRLVAQKITVKNKKTSKKKNAVIKPIIEEVSNNIKEQKEEKSTLSFFNVQGMNNWDGDIKKLYMIQSEEQYLAVNNKYNELKNAGVNLDEIERLKLLLETYPI